MGGFGILLFGALFLIIGTGGLCITFLLLAFAWWKRSRVASVAGTVLSLGAGAILRPWQVFNPPPDDYDRFLDDAWKIFCAFWCLIAMACIVCLFRALRSRKSSSSGSGRSA
jgi:uncharacterized membrane protein